MSNWPTIETTKLSDTLDLQHFEKHGFWIYDKTRGMNLAMRAKTRDEAFVEVISYYQDRLLEVEQNYKELKSKVDTFVVQFVEDKEDYF